MMIETYISLALLTVMLVVAFVVWMDTYTQRERRYQRLLERERVMREGL